ncbi:hypothetical protein [Streptomyces exfoliatus]|uniref:hypothetical protein n=1 Tax=Streptomyces exfoliatus TaxID=1905 RepID=UPI001FE1F100|nr:hypothetical protein [Streptomyces exfoliatus]
MIYRHFNAPSRAFTQFSHELIRHPRLSSDAVRLLTWQLSLPQGARESLSTSAQRARIGGHAFTRAKRQLKEEGFVHERRVQVAGGRWVTQQLVSNTPLTADQAVKLLCRTPDPVTPQVTPSTPAPAAGQPTTPPTDRHPDKDPGEETSNLPDETADVADADAVDGTSCAAFPAPGRPSTGPAASSGTSCATYRPSPCRLDPHPRSPPGSKAPANAPATTPNPCSSGRSPTRPCAPPA